MIFKSAVSEKDTDQTTLATTSDLQASVRNDIRAYLIYLIVNPCGMIFIPVSG
ncbi:MAG: hypothetical protein MESAZ_03023 [Saezia sanguinis]